MKNKMYTPILLTCMLFFLLEAGCTKEKKFPVKIIGRWAPWYDPSHIIKYGLKFPYAHDLYFGPDGKYIEFVGDDCSREKIYCQGNYTINDDMIIIVCIGIISPYQHPTRVDTIIDTLYIKKITWSPLGGTKMTVIYNGRQKRKYYKCKN